MTAEGLVYSLLAYPIILGAWAGMGILIGKIRGEL